MLGARWLVALVAVAALVSGCGLGPAPGGEGPGCVRSFEPGRDYFPDKTGAAYSRRWRVEYRGSYKVLRVDFGPQAGLDDPTDRVRTYVLYRCGTPVPPLTGELAGAVPVRVPVARAVDGVGMLGAFEVLGADTLVGSNATADASAAERRTLPSVTARLADGRAVPVGFAGQLDVERTVATRPDVMFAALGSAEKFDQLTAAGVPVVYYTPYREPGLAAAEQVRFVSLFTDGEAAANAFLTGVVDRYQRIRALASARPTHPAVLVGEEGGGGDFYAPGREAFEVGLVRDAGGRPALDRPGSGVATVPMELVVRQADAAELFVRSDFGRRSSVAQLVAANGALAGLAAVRAGNVATVLSGQRYFSHVALVHPDQALADLVALIHPGLLPGHAATLIGRMAAA